MNNKEIDNDADKGDEHDDSYSKNDEAVTNSQDLLIEDDEEEKDRKRIERNKRERMLSKQRATLKADKNKLMTNQIQKLQQQNAVRTSCYHRSLYPLDHEQCRQAGMLLEGCIYSLLALGSP